MGCQHDIKKRSSGARLIGDSMRNFVSCLAPVLHLQSRFLFQGSRNQVHGIILERTIDHDLATFFFGGVHELAVLAEQKFRAQHDSNQPAQNKNTCSFHDEYSINRSALAYLKARYLSMFV